MIRRIIHHLPGASLAGFASVANMLGGFSAWQARQYPVAD